LVVLAFLWAWIAFSVVYSPLEDEELVAAGAGWSNKAAGLVHEDLAGVGHAGGKAKKECERVPAAWLRGKALVVILVAAKVMGWGGLVDC
jgi:hypothetical protein